MNMPGRRWRTRYEAVEQGFGVGTPLLAVLSLLDFFGALDWAWLLFFWLACGHWSIYAFDAYPLLRHRPFARGLFVVGVGLLWPVWLAMRGGVRRR